MATLWNELIGHKEGVQALLRAYGRNRLSPVLLFAGVSGVGKRLCALALAQTLICRRLKVKAKAEVAEGAAEGTERATEGTDKGDCYIHFHPCGICPDCFRVETLQSESLFYLSSEGKEIKREDSLKVLDFLFLKNLRSLPRVVIINEAHRMNSYASNTLLKILEEPPENSYFIFLTEKLSKILPTIRSRSQVLRFKNLSLEELKCIYKKSFKKDFEKSSKVSRRKDKDFDKNIWILKSARGQMTNLYHLVEGKALRDRVFSALEMSLINGSPFEAYKRVEKDVENREKSLSLTWFLQQILRDICFYKKKESLIHQDREDLIAKMASEWSLKNLISFLMSAFQLEKNILQHLNKSLSFKSYFIQIQQKKVDFKNVLD